MHAYTTDAEDRKLIPTILAVLSIGAAWFLTYIVGLLQLQIPWWVDAPSVIGIYGIFYSFYDRSLWKMHIGPFSLSAIPQVEGVWAGVLNSSYNNGTKKDIVITIRQTWSKISMRLETDTSVSYTIMAALATEESSNPGLTYQYLSEPGPFAEDTMHIHKGTGHVRLSLDGKMFVGDYYTGRGAQTFGTLELHLVSQKPISRETALKSLI